MEKVSFRNLEVNFSWLKNSILYKELSSDLKEFQKELEELTPSIQNQDQIEFLQDQIEQLYEYQYMVCSSTSEDYKALIQTINYWGVNYVPEEVLYTFQKLESNVFIQHLLEIVTDLSLKIFVSKYIMFSTYCNKRQKFCDVMAYYGYIDMLSWGLKNRFYNNLIEINVNAVKGNQIKVLEFLLNNGYSVSNETTAEAIKNNNMNIIVFLAERNILEINDFENFKNALRYGSREIIDFFYNDYTDLNYTYCLSRFKANVEGLDWIYDKNIPISEFLLELIIQTGNLDAFKWIYSKGFIPDDINLIIFEEYIDILNFLHENKYHFTEQDFKYSIRENKIKIIDFFVKIGFIVDRSTLFYYLTSCYKLKYEVVDYFIKKGIEKIPKIMYNFLRRSTNLAEIELLLKNDFPFEKYEALEEILFSKESEEQKINLLIKYAKISIDINIVLMFIHNNNEYLFSKYYRMFNKYDYYTLFYEKYSNLDYNVLNLIYKVTKKQPTNEFLSKLTDKELIYNIKRWLK